MNANDSCEQYVTNWSGLKRLVPDTEGSYIHTIRGISEDTNDNQAI